MVLTIGLNHGVKEKNEMREFIDSGYPLTLVQRFTDIVTQHIESLPGEYYRAMREFTGNGPTLPAGAASIYALGFDFMEDHKKMLAPRVLVEKYIGVTAAPFDVMISGYDAPEKVGEIDGCPVCFLRAPGEYLFEAANAGGVLSVGLTGAFYPPVLPARTAWEKGA